MQKTIQWVVCAALLTVSWGAQAQYTNTRFGLKAGANLAVLDGLINEEPSSRVAPHFGAFVRFRTSQHFAFQPEVLYSSQGAHVSYPSTEFGEIEGDRKVTYLAVPLLAKVYIGSVFYIQAGPQAGLLLGAKYDGEVVKYTSNSNGGTARVEKNEIDNKKEYKSDIALCGGLGADFKNGLTVSARLNYGVTNIDNLEARQQFRDRFGLDGMHNRVIQFSVGYIFGKD
jgi:hypothetical protein